MSFRAQILAICVFLSLPATSAHADIFRWDNGQLIPGTEGITARPRMSLREWNSESRNLRYADFSGGLGLSESRFESSWLDHSDFSGANLTGAYLFDSVLSNANLAGVNLTGANLTRSVLSNADLTDAEVTGANLGETRGLTRVQLTSTASYKAKNLESIQLFLNDLNGWDFSGQNLTGANLYGSLLSNTDLTDAEVTGASFGDTTEHGLTQAQLTSTASYKARNLQGIRLAYNDMTAWDFSVQNLSNADLSNSTLTNTNLTGANLADAALWSSVMTGANFNGAVIRGAQFGGSAITSSQLYSTASYRDKDLQRVGFGWNDDLRGWDFSGQNLEQAGFWGADLSGADFRGANLTGTQFSGSIVGPVSAKLHGANFTGAEIRDAGFAAATYAGFIADQLYSTASYKNRRLDSVFLGDNDLTGWDFAGQSLVNADLHHANLRGADFTGADLRGVEMWEANLSQANLTGARFDSARLTDANLTGADTRGASGLELTGAITTNLIRPDGRVDDLILPAGEELIAYAGVPIPVKFTGGFAIAPTAKFDLTDNAAIVDSTGTFSVPNVRERIVSGRGGRGLGGAWNGPGITSSTAAAANQTAPDSRSIGYADNATMPLGPYSTFHGQPVDKTSILMAYTRTGDANLDGVVNDDDVTIVGANYAPGFAKPQWALGDFDYNGFVDDDDVTLLGAFYDPSAVSLAAPVPTATTNVAAVPEPSSISLLAIAALACGLLVGRRAACERRVA